MKDLPRNMRNEFRDRKREKYEEETLKEHENIVVVFNKDKGQLRINGRKDYGSRQFKIHFHLLP